MLTEAFINERCAVILGSSAVNPVYTFGLVCTGLGFFSFSLLRRLCKKEKWHIVKSSATHRGKRLRMGNASLNICGA